MGNNDELLAEIARLQAAIQQKKQRSRPWWAMRGPKGGTYHPHATGSTHYGPRVRTVKPVHFPLASRNRTWVNPTAMGSSLGGSSATAFRTANIKQTTTSPRGVKSEETSPSTTSLAGSQGSSTCSDTPSHPIVNGGGDSVQKGYVRCGNKLVRVGAPAIARPTLSRTFVKPRLNTMTPRWSSKPLLPRRARKITVGNSAFWVNRTGYTLVRQQTPAKPRTESTTPKGYTKAGQRSLVRSALVSPTASSTPKKKTRRYCTFYNRFGRCSAGDRCPFIHDPTRVALCSRFLRGRCKEGNKCPFSHELKPEQLPLCSHFQRGACHNPDCPYIHIKVSADAPVCRFFVDDGFCPHGRECPKRHVYECPEFSETGRCTRPNCRLPHYCRTTVGRKRSPRLFSREKLAKPAEVTKRKRPLRMSRNLTLKVTQPPRPQPRYMESAAQEKSTSVVPRTSSSTTRRLTATSTMDQPKKPEEGLFRKNYDFISLDDDDEDE
ncbi:hypothetical protein IWQ61_001966 [Dispira simplex]|nr:hypothetical protein IWQ61_001966 [Dispira simplex]